MYKIDFHTHSIMSYDGSITEKEYSEILRSKKLDYIAITDHNRIDFALEMRQKLGSKIIVGEEINTRVGEVIGLFLTETIPANLSLTDTIDAIHEQGGLVYAPHPFDTWRRGIGKVLLLSKLSSVDIIEGFNGRMKFRWNNRMALDFAKKYNIAFGTGSDAHSMRGLGGSYTKIAARPTAKNTVSLLKKATYHFQYQQWYAYLYPLINKVTKTIRAII